MADSASKKRRNLLTGLAFLAPNMLGVLTFVVFPVLFAIMLAFTNWDLTRHNMFHPDEPLRFVGLDNFIRLFSEGDFLRFLGNTLFLMMGIPFAIGGALFAATLLIKDTRGGDKLVWGWLIAGFVLIGSVALLAVTGLGQTGMIILLTGIACGIAVIGVTGGVTVYRTLFYTPHFTAGVATFLLWKKLYNPYDGPINNFLSPPVDALSRTVSATPALMYQLVSWLLLAAMLLLFAWGIKKLRQLWVDGDVGTGVLLLPTLFMLIPMATAVSWSMIYPPGEAQIALMTEPQAIAEAAGVSLAQAGEMIQPVTLVQSMQDWALIGFGVIVVGVLLYQVTRIFVNGRDFRCDLMNGAGSGLVLGAVVMVGLFVLLGFAAILYNLPWMVHNPRDLGLAPPEWIADYDWAKPSLMIMGLWGAIGSNNMLLYIAALTNVPGELYEAADMDGASRFQRFWNVTWPQLAPTTFFIGVMSTIGGLQGGFEAARTMTQGGPDGATTTLSYFVYQEGFETGRLGYSAGIAWALFLLVFAVTMFNWKFGNKYVND